MLSVRAKPKAALLGRSVGAGATLRSKPSAPITTVFWRRISDTCWLVFAYGSPPTGSCPTSVMFFMSSDRDCVVRAESVRCGFACDLLRCFGAEGERLGRAEQDSDSWEVCARERE